MRRQEAMERKNHSKNLDNNDEEEEFPNEEEEELEEVIVLKILMKANRRTKVQVPMYEIEDKKEVRYPAT